MTDSGDSHAKPSSAAKKALRSHLLHIESEGSKTIGFRYISHTAIAYAEDPTWHEAGTYAVQRFPTFPGTAIFMGGYLSAAYVAWRYGLESLEQLVPRAVACHEGTRIININTPLAAASRFPFNRWAIIHFAVDLIISRMQAGLTTALLMRCDKRAKDGEAPVADEDKHMTNAITDILSELRARGFDQVEIIAAGQPLPEASSPTVIPVITYGMAGLGRFEDYGAVFAVHAYHIDPKVLADCAYDDLPPSRRPRLAFARGRQRTLDWSNAKGVSSELRRRAELMLERLEMDTTVQAIQRIRCGIKPRLVIANMRCDPVPFLGRVESVPKLTAVRLLLGLPLDTRGSRRDQQAAAVGALVAQGQTLSGAAAALGLSRSKVTGLRKSYGSTWTVPKGRPPPTAGESAQNSPVETSLVDFAHLSPLTHAG